MLVFEGRRLPVRSRDRSEWITQILNPSTDFEKKNVPGPPYGVGLVPLRKCDNLEELRLIRVAASRRPRERSGIYIRLVSCVDLSCLFSICPKKGTPILLR